MYVSVWEGVDEMGIGMIIGQGMPREGSQSNVNSKVGYVIVYHVKGIFEGIFIGYF